MPNRMSAGILFAALALPSACKSKDDTITRMIKEDEARGESARRETEELVRPQKEEAQRKRQLEMDYEACRRLAKETRDCRAGLPCERASDKDVEGCRRHMRENNFDKNPY